MAGDDLIPRAQQGDEKAVEALFRREWMPVYRLLYRSLGNRQEAEDLTQEVFIRALSALDRYEQTSTPFAGYLNVVARNLLRDRWRQRGLSLTALVDAEHVHSAAEGPERLVLAGDERARVDDLLASLPPDHQQVIRLRVIEGRSTDDVARIMQRSPGAIRVLQHRAIAMLRTQLREGTRG